MFGKKTFGFEVLIIFAIVGTIRNPISTGIIGTPNRKSSIPIVYLKSEDMSDSPGILKANPIEHKIPFTTIFFLL